MVKYMLEVVIENYNSGRNFTGAEMSALLAPLLEIGREFLW